MPLTLEYDCPIDGIDYDAEAAHAAPGMRIQCVGCGHEHTAGVDVDVNVLAEDGTFLFAIDAEARG